MGDPLKQHVIDPEICIRCYTCEMTCPLEAIEHDDNNVVVDASKCNHCMDCVPVCPTGSIDNWRVVSEPYTLEEQYSWEELPEEQLQVKIESASGEGTQAQDLVEALLAEAHSGVEGKAKAPESASTPTTALYRPANPIEATVQGNYKLTSDDSDSDVRHLILDFQGKPFPVIEGQSIGITAPGQGSNGKQHLPRLYSISSPRDGERPGYHNVSLTVKREKDGVCSNYLCDLEKGDKVPVTGPFGSTFLMPTDPDARLLMICTGTGSAPMRAFTMARERTVGEKDGGMMMFFGARTHESLPYFGPLKKVPSSLLQKHLVFSRLPDSPKEYVQDAMRKQSAVVAEWLKDQHTHIYVCGLKDMEEGVEQAFESIAQSAGLDWQVKRVEMLSAGRYHVETY